MIFLICITPKSSCCRTRCRFSSWSLVGCTHPLLVETGQSSLSQQPSGEDRATKREAGDTHTSEGETSGSEVPHLGTALFSICHIHRNVCVTFRAAAAFFTAVLQQCLNKPINCAVLKSTVQACFPPTLMTLLYLQAPTPTPINRILEWAKHTNIRERPNCDFAIKQHPWYVCGLRTPSFPHALASLSTQNK